MLASIYGRWRPLLFMYSSASASVFSVYREIPKKFSATKNGMIERISFQQSEFVSVSQLWRCLSTLPDENARGVVGKRWAFRPSAPPKPPGGPFRHACASERMRIWAVERSERMCQASWPRYHNVTQPRIARLGTTKRELGSLAFRPAPASQQPCTQKELSQHGSSSNTHSIIRSPSIFQPVLFCLPWVELAPILYFLHTAVNKFGPTSTFQKEGTHAPPPRLGGCQLPRMLKETSVLQKHFSLHISPILRTFPSGGGGIKPSPSSLPLQVRRCTRPQQSQNIKEMLMISAEWRCFSSEDFRN